MKGKRWAFIIECLGTTARLEAVRHVSDIKSKQAGRLANMEANLYYFQPVLIGVSSHSLRCFPARMSSLRSLP